MAQQTATERAIRARERKSRTAWASRERRRERLAEEAIEEREESDEDTDADEAEAK